MFLCLLTLLEDVSGDQDCHTERKMTVVTTIKTATRVFRKNSKTSVSTEAVATLPAKTSVDSDGQSSTEAWLKPVSRSQKMLLRVETGPCVEPIVVKQLVGVHANLARSSIWTRRCLNPWQERERWTHSPWLVTKTESEERSDVVRTV